MRILIILSLIFLSSCEYFDKQRKHEIGYLQVGCYKDYIKKLSEYQIDGHILKSVSDYCEGPNNKYGGMDYDNCIHDLFYDNESNLNQCLDSAKEYVDSKANS